MIYGEYDYEAGLNHLQVDDVASPDDRYKPRSRSLLNSTPPRDLTLTSTITKEGRFVAKNRFHVSL
jgi:hypothetical protein